MNNSRKIAILGGGNIGCAIANGLENSGLFKPEDIIITRRSLEHLTDFRKRGFHIQSDNKDAVNKADIVFIAVQPQQFNGLVSEIKSSLDPERHIIISVVSGVTIRQIIDHIEKEPPIIRAMPNTAIAIGESMTCIATNNKSKEAVDIAISIFNSVGRTQVVSETLITSATALCACGIAFFLRAIRAAAQGGIEVGFHPDEAIPMAAQTARGAASLLLQMENHPEMEIDKVTTPRGCTISGLNEMEHQGFSSAMIRGILTSAKKADVLYSGNG